MHQGAAQNWQLYVLAKSSTPWWPGTPFNTMCHCTPQEIPAK